MKTAKRLLALALAGVMVLALLTGCSDSSSQAKQVEEYFRYRRGQFADYQKDETLDRKLKVIARHADDYIEQEILVLGEVSDQLAECLKGLLVSSISTVVKYCLDTGMKAAPERVAYVLDTYCFSGIKGFLDNKEKF